MRVCRSFHQDSRAAFCSTRHRTLHVSCHRQSCRRPDHDFRSSCELSGEHSHHVSKRCARELMMTLRQEILPCQNLYPLRAAQEVDVGFVPTGSRKGLVSSPRANQNVSWDLDPIRFDPTRGSHLPKTVRGTRDVASSVPIVKKRARARRRRALERTEDPDTEHST